MNDATPVAGITCSFCGGSALRIYKTRTAAAVGLVLRYRECVACKGRVKTREYVETVIRPGRPKLAITIPTSPESPVE